MKPARDEPKDNAGDAGDIGDLKNEWDRVRPSLDERRRRHWAAEKARGIGTGGISLVFQATGMARDTIRRGIAELGEAEDERLRGRVRAPGGGRKPRTKADTGLPDALEALIGPSKNAAKAPLRWTTKSIVTLAREMSLAKDSVGQRSVAALLRGQGYELRCRGGRPVTEALADADALFEQLHAGVVRFHGRGDPVVAVDVFRRRSDGTLKPTGDKTPVPGSDGHVSPIVDPALARFFADGLPPDPSDRVNWREVCIDRDTAAFAAASIRGWRRNMGEHRFCSSKHVLVVANFNHRDHLGAEAWRVALEDLADDLDVTVEAHRLPRRTIRWSSIEQCLLNYTARAGGDGEMLDRLGVVRLIGSSGGGRPVVQAALDACRYPPDGAGAAGRRRDVDVAWIIKPKSGRS